MRLTFLSGDPIFFRKFLELAELGVREGELLAALLDDFVHLEDRLDEIEAVEHQGDAVVHDIAVRLARSLLTPMDREDIHALATVLDDILDYIHGSAVKMATYQVERPTAAARELTRLIQACTRILVPAVERLTRRADISDLRREVKRLEKEADRVRQDAVADLFRNCRDPIELIKWKEIYKGLETVTDRCEDVMDILEGMIIKYS